MPGNAAGVAGSQPLDAQASEAGCESVMAVEGRVGDRTRTGDIQIHSQDCCLLRAFGHCWTGIVILGKTTGKQAIFCHFNHLAR